MVTISLLSSSTFNVERHAYCLCLHVRPATIFVAVINLSGSLLCALLTFFFMVNSDINGSGTSSSRGNYFTSRFVRDDLNRINLISVLLYLLLALVSAMLLYGVIKSKPRYILPFFGIQCIDYLFTWPQFFASITHPYHYYVAKSKTMMDDGGIGAGGKSTNMDEMRNVWSPHSHVYTTSLLILTLIMIFKTYFLCVVWKCHRYLHMKELILPITLSAGNMNDEHTILPCILRGENPRTVTVAAGVPPPNYEEATKLPDYKPPEYTTVIAEQEAQTTTNNSDNSFTTVALDSPTTTPQAETQTKNIV